MKKEDFLFIIAIIPLLIFLAFYNTGGPIYPKENFHQTPLMQAAYKGDIQEMKKLLDNKADVNATNDLGLAALFFAAGASPTSPRKDHGSTEAVKFLLDHGAAVNGGTKSDYTPLMAAIDNHNIATAKLLISHGADINIRHNGKTALMNILDRLHEQQMTELLLDNTDISKEGENLLIYITKATSRSYITSVDYDNLFTIANLLLDKGVNPQHQNKMGESAFAIATSMCNGTMTRAFLDHGAKANQELPGLHSTPIIETARCNNRLMAQNLLNHGANANAADKSGKTALDYGIEKCNSSLIKMLIEHGADLNRKNPNGFTPLMNSLSCNDDALSAVLLRHGARASAKDNSGKTALDHAKLNGTSPALIKLLEEAEK